MNNKVTIKVDRDASIGVSNKREVIVNGKSIGFATHTSYGRFGYGPWYLRLHGSTEKPQAFYYLADLRQKAAEVN
jgi:hypothetical protein